MQHFVMAIDQGTTSTRAILFDRAGTIHASAQKEHRQIYPRAGWVEHDSLEIWRLTREVVGLAVARGNVTPSDIAAVGITNQRETTVVWDRHTGEPIHNAIVWQDTRTQAICDVLAREGGVDRFRATTGRPLATYFAAPKIRWTLDNVAGAQQAAESGELLAGTIDTWLLWNLTGGASGGVHLTDVTNASRTLLLDLHTLDWDETIAAEFNIPLKMLPRVSPSSSEFGFGRRGGLLPDVPFTGVLGDQHAATVGQTCFYSGAAKNTYGTGNFLLVNTGTVPKESSHGLITTVAFQFGDAPAQYALEGSIAVTGSLVQWMRDNLGLIDEAREIEALAARVPDSGGAYFVPAFSGLFAPYWRPDARGTLTGLTGFINKHHIARAVLEATAFQTRDVLEAVREDTGLTFNELRVDGGMVENSLLMQFQADILGIDVVRPKVTETTALGAAYAAGVQVGFWANLSDVVQNWHEGQRWEAAMDAQERAQRYAMWKKAVEKSMNWIARTDPK